MAPTPSSSVTLLEHGSVVVGEGPACIERGGEEGIYIYIGWGGGGGREVETLLPQERKGGEKELYA